MTVHVEHRSELTITVKTLSTFGWPNVASALAEKAACEDCVIEELLCEAQAALKLLTNVNPETIRPRFVRSDELRADQLLRGDVIEYEYDDGQRERMELVTVLGRERGQVIELSSSAGHRLQVDPSKKVKTVSLVTR